MFSLILLIQFFFGISIFISTLKKNWDLSFVSLRPGCKSLYPLNKLGKNMQRNISDKEQINEDVSCRYEECINEYYINIYIVKQQ